MNKVHPFLQIILFATLLSLISSCTAKKEYLDKAYRAEIKVIAPTVGPTLRGGTSTTIKWDTGLDIEKVNIKYSVDWGNSWHYIAEKHDYTSGQINWLVPQVHTEGTILEIYDYKLPGIRGISNYFTIQSTINSPPEAFSGVFQTIQGHSVNIDVMKYSRDDVSLDPTSVSIVLDVQSEKGTALIYPNGTIRVNVDEEYAGSFEVQYQVCDQGVTVLCDTAVITVDVAPIAQQEWAMDDWGVLNTKETLTGNLIRNDYLLNSSWSFERWDVVRMMHGNITVDPSNGDYTYVPSSMGRDTIQYVVSKDSIRDTAYLHLFIVEDRPLAKDSMDLVILYEMTDGSNWEYQWDLSQPVATWHGIGCDDSSVQSLFLEGNQLRGSLPDFSNLNKLKWMRLSSNQLTGSLPNFSNLGDLTVLILCHNNFKGSVPEFSNLKHLIQLNLGTNQLTGSIPDFSTLNKLTSLVLTNNHLTGSIPNFSNLDSLRSLELYANQLEGRIPDFSNLNYLYRLNLSRNQLTGSIPDFSNLNKLTYLSLSFNQLVGNMPDFSTLNELTSLVLTNNHLTGSIFGFSNLDCLKLLDLSYNRLTGSVPDFPNFYHLKTLDLSNNYLSGSIPDFSTLYCLTSLNMSYNHLSGSIPNYLNLENVTALDLSHNRLTGSHPNLSHMRNLKNDSKHLFSGNQLIGLRTR